MKKSELRALVKEEVRKILIEQASKKLKEEYTNEPKPTKAPKKGYKWVRNIMSGKWVEEPEDLPFTQSVSSETYWSS